MSLSPEDGLLYAKRLCGALKWGPSTVEGLTECAMIICDRCQTPTQAEQALLAIRRTWDTWPGPASIDAFIVRTLAPLRASEPRPPTAAELSWEQELQAAEAQFAKLPKSSQAKILAGKRARLDSDPTWRDSHNPSETEHQAYWLAILDVLTPPTPTSKPSTPPPAVQPAPVPTKHTAADPHERQRQRWINFYLTQPAAVRLRLDKIAFAGATIAEREAILEALANHTHPALESELTIPTAGQILKKRKERRSGKK